jgi:hypothetical protein
MPWSTWATSPSAQTVELVPAILLRLRGNSSGSPKRSRTKTPSRFLPTADLAGVRGRALLIALGLEYPA